MIRFLFIYLSIYSLAHFYIFRKIKISFTPGKKASIAIILIMAVMIIAPVLVRLAEKGGFETGARILSYAGFSWMGLLFLLIVLSGAVDGIRCFLRQSEKIGLQLPTPARISPRKLLITQMLVVIVFYGYGLFEAADIRLEKVEIVSPKIPAIPGRIRIVQISDVHLGLIIREAKLGKILAKIKEAHPDILISTGDLVDGQLNHLNTEADMLAVFKPPLGKIAITGNHEFYAGLDNALEFTRQSGFIILRHQGMLAGGINFVGVDDRTLSSWGREPLKSEHDLLLAQPQQNFTVLLKHRPDINPESLGHFDLQLSGHTHKGQIFPFNLLTWLRIPNRPATLPHWKAAGSTSVAAPEPGGRPSASWPRRR